MKKTINTLNLGRLGRWTALALALNMAAGCAPLVLGSAIGGAFVASDRRTSGTQLEDKSIELKAGSRIRETVTIGAHVNATAYNRMVLLTGEVASEADRAAVEQAVARVENVQSVVNELAVMGVSSLGSRSSDVLINGKIKASFVDARDMFSNAFKVVVERGDVYLLGLVTEREANRAAEVASGVSGVTKVVKVFSLITEDELARRTPAPAPQATAPAASNP
ncbi:BON domain-containing protein [Aquabacterium sp.]|uniref:BON domain-containing protein n=1 Tax=Aquabacterium sp. TaxID=1872578 RepID=UPI003D6DA09C